MFHDAKWIGRPESDNGSFLFRKEFIIAEGLLSARLQVCGLGYGEYSLNGKRISDEVLSTPFTKFDSTVLYSGYDVTEYLLQGRNALGVFLGNGWYNDVGEVWNYDTATWRHHPKMILQLDLEYNDGTTFSLLSDSSWKCSDGPSVYNHVREGEIYDARLEQEGWNTPGFDDGSWAHATVCRGAGGILKPAELPPIRIIRVLTPRDLGGGVYDFGENISGWAKIKGSAPSGHEVSLHYSELYRNGDIDNEEITKFIKGELKHCDKYIFKGKGREVWEPRFSYHGFRYVKVENAPSDFEITACVLHTDLETIGEFECSDDMLNRIHEAARRSTLTNYHSIPTDCPHREQNGWTGDALLSCEQSLYNFNMISAYKKWLNDFKDVQRPNGQLPGIIPTSNWGYNWGSGPAWDSALIQIPWHVYEFTGDSSLILDMWENMKRYMGYLYSMQEDWMVDFGLGDWEAPVDTIPCPTKVTDTAYYYADAKIMEKCAKVLGEDPGPWEVLSENIRRAFRENLIKDGIVLGNCQTSLACGIYQGLYNPEEIPLAAEKLAELVKKNGYHIDCGILGTKYIFSALSENGYGEVAYQMVINPEYPSYAYWMKQGMTTLCESWEMKESCNHHMFSEVETWFYRHLAGIRIKNGRIIVKPCFIPGIDWVKAKHGDVSVSWNDTEITIETKYPGQYITGDQVDEFLPGIHKYARSNSLSD